MAKKVVKKKKEPNPVGRPREHDRDKIALDMIEWAKKPNSINLNAFSCNYEPTLTPSMILLWAKEDPEFRRAYDRVKSYVAARREEWLNSERLHVKAYDLNACAYDAYTKADREEKSEFESKLKANDQKPVDEEAIRMAALMIEQMRSMQEKKG